MSTWRERAHTDTSATQPSDTRKRKAHNNKLTNRKTTDECCDEKDSQSTKLNNDWGIKVLKLDETAKSASTPPHIQFNQRKDGGWSDETTN